MKATRKEVIIFGLANKILETHGDRVDSMDLIENSINGDESIKIYHGKGHCFELKKEYICEPDEVLNFDGVCDDGYCYTFFEPWDGFTETGIDKAIELLNEYAEI